MTQVMVRQRMFRCETEGCQDLPDMDFVAMLAHLVEEHQLGAKWNRSHVIGRRKVIIDADPLCGRRELVQSWPRPNGCETKYLWRMVAGRVKFTEYDRYGESERWP